VLEAQYQQERHEQSEFQRFLRQHNHNTTVEGLGFAGYDPALEDRYRPLVPQLEVAKPIEERLEVLRCYSTVKNYESRRYSTPPTTPELPAIRPVGQAHNILPPHPDLMLTTPGQPPRQPDHIWYSLEIYAGTLGQARETMHPLEKAFICNKLGLHIEALLLVYKSEFPFVPWSDA
jgi:hypothetical protein